MKTTNYWYSKVFIVIVLALFLAPSVTFAAWYNPFTWSIWSIFKKSDAPVVVQVDTISTSTPSVSTSTETKKDVAPETQKKTVTAPSPVQPKAEPIVVQVEDTTEVTANLAAIKSNVLKIVNSRNAWISDMKEDRASFTSSKYKSEYAALIKIYDFVIADLETEKSLAQSISDTIDATPLSAQADSYENISGAYTSLLATVNATNAEKINTLASIATLAGQSNDLVKSVIQLEATNDLSSQYGGSSDSVSLHAERDSLNTKADAYIKQISDAQKKLRGDSKEKVETYLKAIIYSPIGNKGWLNSR